MSNRKLLEQSAPDLWDLLMDVNNKFSNISISELLNYIGVSERNTFDKESPMFILPNGSIISVGDALDANEDILPFNVENIHASLIRCFAVRLAYDEGYASDVIEQMEEYDMDVNDVFVDMINDLTFNDGWIRINCGQTWEEERFYAVLPNSVTSSQYNTLEDWLEFGIDLGQKVVMIYATDKDDYHEYPLDGDLFPEDIIKRIKRYYSSGKFYEKHSLNSNLTEVYEKRDGIVYDHYSTGVVGEQVNYVVVATKDDILIGYIQYAYYKDTVNIQMIEVSEAYRRQGIATKMMQYLQKQYPDTEINPGMTTPDGTEFFKNIFVEVPSEEKQKLFNRKTRWEKSYYKMAEELKGVEKELDAFYNTPDEDISDEYREHIQTVADRWQELYDKMRDIDHKLWDFYTEYGKMTSPKKKIVKGEF